MLRPRHGMTVVICVSGLFSAACATRMATTPVPQPFPTVAADPAPSPSPSPTPSAAGVAELIALSTRHFETGERELEQGDLDAANAALSRALDLLLESPFGAAEPSVREHLDRFVERLAAYGLTDLWQGGGPAEGTFDPAAVDGLLALSTGDDPAATPETRETVESDLETIGHDIDIPLNPRVLQFVELFTGRMKGFLEEGLSNGARFLPMIQEVFRAEGLPLDLAYVPLVESAFKPSALSRAKARGIWQFMRGTGLENGLKHDWYIDERAEPEKSTRAAAKYLKTLRDMFDGDWHLALASYNGGPGRVQRAIDRSGRADFWTLSASPKYLPRETRDYVPLILASIIIARNPAQYGMSIAPVDVPAVETVTLDGAVDLRRVASWVGAPTRTIQDLNPELRRWITPVRETDYELKVPKGTADIVRAHLAVTDPTEFSPLSWHTVKKGETLLSIAKKLKVSRTDLAESNYLSVRSTLSIGQRLIVPRAPALRLAARRDDGDEPDAVAASNVALEPAPPPSRLVYRVKRGDTLFAIARLHGTTAASLKSWNNLRSTRLQVGQRLTIHTARTTLATN